MKSLKLIVIVLAALSFSCSSNSDDSDDLFISGGTRLTAKIDGRNFAALDEATVAGFSQSDNVTVILIGGAFSEFVSDATIATESIGLGLTVIQNATFGASSQWYANNEDASIIVTGTYLRNNTTNSVSNEVEATSDFEEASARIRVTQLNRVSGLMSGEFEFVARDDRTGDTFVITEGKFNDVPFENN